MNNIEFREEFSSYPEVVLDYSQKLTNALSEDNFFNDEEINPRIFFETLCEESTKKFIDDGSTILTEDEMMNVITNSCARSMLMSLKMKGILDSIETEDGEEKFFLTEQGKLIADIMMEEEARKENKE